MGEALLVADPSQGGKLLVLKKVRQKSFATNLELLRREFSTLIRLSHPNIARVFKYGEASDGYYFLEEYIDGTDIFAATYRANYNQILAALAQVLRALIYLHQRGIIHGDIKAANILVVRNASLFSHDSIKLIDFGLAKQRHETAMENLPSGSLHFMAPEILLERPYDHRADLYALGVCLYRMITGRHPFEHEEKDLARLIQAQIVETPVAPQRFQTDLPKGLNEIAMRLLAKSPEDRFSSAVEVLEAMNALEGENFPLWTLREVQLALHAGPFIDREEELSRLHELYRSGHREFTLLGEPGLGRRRLEQEFRYQLQLAGCDDCQLKFHREPRIPQSTAPAVALSAWGPAQIEDFLKDRFRGETIPRGLSDLLLKLSKGNPAKLIMLLDFSLKEGLIRIERDWAEFRPALFERLPDFETVQLKRAAALEQEKQEILQLCTFARQPLSKELLGKMIGLAPESLEDHLHSLEQGGWIHRILHQGVYQYEVQGEAVKNFLHAFSGGKSLESRFKYIEETYRLGNHLEAKTLLEAFLAELPKKLEALKREQQIQILGTASLIFLETGDLEQARSYCEKFLHVPKLPPYEMGRILNRLGWIEYRQGQYREALKIFERSEQQWKLAADASGLASVANFKATAHQALGNHHKAMELYREAIKLLKEGDAWRPLIRTNLAALLQEAEDFGGALLEYQVAKEESENGSDPYLRARLGNALANLHLYLGQLSEARDYAHDSLKVSLKHGLSLLEGQNYLLLSTVADREGNLEEHRHFIERAVGLFERHGTAGEKARAKLHQAYYFFTAGEDAKVAALLEEIRRCFPEESAILIQCELLAGKMEARKEIPDWRRGTAFLEKTLNYFEFKKDQANLWEVYLTLGELWRKHDAAKALQYYRQALEILEALAGKLPEKFRNSFFRDRKRERILADMAALAPTKESPHDDREVEPMNNGLFTEMARITRMLASGHNIHFLLETILEDSLDLLKAERGFILLFEAGDFRVKAVRNIERKILEEEPERYSNTIAGQAAMKGQSIMVRNAAQDERFQSAESVVGMGIRAALAVPMKIGAETVGVIYLDNRFRSDGFDEGKRELLEAFADQAALAIRNARQVEDIQSKEKMLASSMQQIEELNRLLKERLENREFELTDLKEKFEAQQGELHLKYSYDQIIGQSAKLKEVLRVLDRVTDSAATVLITGESGTGKELIARALHFNSPRKEAPFLAENCSAFSETLLESELFGHVKGSFTGALTDRKGIFEVAQGGTVFLDELGEMPAGMQPKLLRVLQERQVRPLGGKEYKKVDVRLVAATNKKLEDLVSAGKFREDLFYRVNVIRIQLPPLRERREDIPLLVEHFLKVYAEKSGKKLKISPQAKDILLRYDWPGNIRELANEIQKCCAMAPKAITPELISDHIRARPISPLEMGSLEEGLKHTERALILEALRRSKFSKVKAAQVLKISRITLYKKMRLHKIKLKDPSYE